jgi:hypothetical protein
MRTCFDIMGCTASNERALVLSTTPLERAAEGRPSKTNANPANSNNSGTTTTTTNRDAHPATITVANQIGQHHEGRGRFLKPKRRRSSPHDLVVVERMSGIGHDQQEQDHADGSYEIQGMLEHLSSEELETAARACYEYVKKNRLPCLSSNDKTKRQQRDIYASHICRRYLHSKRGDVALATRKVKKTLQFRNDYDLEGLMTAFDDKNNNSYCRLQKNLSERKFFVQGYDKEGRSTLFFIPRNTRGFDKEWHLKEALYSIERAIACSKVWTPATCTATCTSSTSSEEDDSSSSSSSTVNSTTTMIAPVNAVVDFSGFSLSKHSPPMDIATQFLTSLRSHYAGQINKIFLLDCPTSFFVLWKIVSPFVGTETRNKIHFCSGAKSKAKLLTEWYDLEEMPSFMCPGGGKNRDFDLEEYLFELPFDRSFDEDTTSIPVLGSNKNRVLLSGRWCNKGERWVDSTVVQ